MSSEPPPNPGHRRRESLTRVFAKLKRSVTKRSSRSEPSTEPQPIVESSTKTKDKPLVSNAPAPTTTPEFDQTDPTHTAHQALASTSFGPEVLEVDNQLQESALELPKRAISVPIHRNQSSQTRLIMLGDQYGVNFEDLGLEIYPDAPRAGVTRVEKKIKMRVRYTCHSCQHRFGASKTCRKCEHTRCSDCPREPAKKNRERSDHPDTLLESTSHNTETRSDPLLLASRAFIQRSSQPPGMPAQRVLYTCHECESPFLVGTAHHCANCGHRRCNRCSRQLARPVQSPQNLEQAITLTPEAPNASPKLRVWKSPRQRVRWSCHECQANYSQGSKICANCKHARCDSCTREPPQRRNMEITT